jgi:D-sedoheptulose 7-phosphate isomerase
MEKLRGHVSELKSTLDLLPVDLIGELVSILQEARVNRRQIFIMGNGGSASTATHFVADLSKNTRLEKIPDFRVLGLTDNMAVLTAYANDEGYENVFAQQLANFVRPYDVVIAISASGNSKNVLRAVELARQVKAYTVGMTGFDGGKLGSIVDLNIHILSDIIEQVEDLHLVVEHMVVKTLREIAREVEIGEAVFTDIALGEITVTNGHQP